MPKPISNNTLTESSWGYSTEYILAVVGVDADGNFGKLNWAKLKTPARSSSGDQGQSEAALRIQHVVVNSSELEGAPENCFATVYRFEPTAGARAFRYEDGYYKGDFAKRRHPTGASISRRSPMPTAKTTTATTPAGKAAWIWK